MRVKLVVDLLSVNAEERLFTSILLCMRAKAHVRLSTKKPALLISKYIPVVHRIWPTKKCEQKASNKKVLYRVIETSK